MMFCRFFVDLVRDSNWNMVQVMRQVSPPSYGFNGSTVKIHHLGDGKCDGRKHPKGCFFLIRDSFRIWGFTWLYGWWSTLESPMFKADSQVCVWINLGALSWYSNNNTLKLIHSNHHLHRWLFSIHFPPPQKNTWSHHKRLYKKGPGPPCFQRWWPTRTNLDLCQGNPELLVISGGKEWDILRKTTVTAKSLENPLPETKTAPENRPFNAPKTNEKVVQLSIFRCELLVFRGVGPRASEKRHIIWTNHQFSGASCLFRGV